MNNDFLQKIEPTNGETQISRGQRNPAPSRPKKARSVAGLRDGAVGLRGLPSLSLFLVNL